MTSEERLEQFCIRTGTGFDEDLFMELAAEFAAVRREALEEAAERVEKNMDCASAESAATQKAYASAIRALQDKPKEGGK